MEYSYYVQNIGLCYSEEHDIWREIKNEKYNKNYVQCFRKENKNNMSENE